MEKVKIGIIGLGMVGSPHRRWFEERRGYQRGVNLFCYDTDPTLGFFDDVNRGSVIFVSVSTPPNPDGSCNISMVDNALSTIKGDKIAVIKSTVFPGTTEMFQRKYPHLRILFSPEFLTESQAWEDFLHPTRQLIGYTEKSKGDSIKVLNLLPQGNFSSPWISDYSRFEMTATEAEFVKYFSNVFGAVKVTLANIIFDLCQAKSKKSNLPINYENIREAVGADPRIGPSWLDVHHGFCRGFTGFCFPKDLNAFISFVYELHNPKSCYTDIDGIMLAEGEQVLKSIRTYNRVLLNYQGHTEEGVSRHEKELK